MRIMLYGLKDNIEIQMVISIHYIFYKLSFKKFLAYCAAFLNRYSNCGPSNVKHKPRHRSPTNELFMQ